MSTSNEQISTEDLFRRALEASSRAQNLPSMKDETQEIVSSALQDLRAVAFRVNVLGLFSPNESFEEISVRHIPYMLVPYVVGEMQLRVKGLEPEERTPIVQSAKIAFDSFVKLLDDYSVIPQEERKLHASPLPADAWKRRDVQVAQYKGKKAIKENVEALRSRRRRTSASTGGSTTDFDMISDMLPTSGANDEEDEDAIRELLRAVLKLFWVQTLDQLKGIEREEEMLKGAPPKSERKQAPGPPENDDAWRLDMPAGGRLLDEKGKPLRPFIILPSRTADRERLKAGVFQPDHRLPTMTVDELLEIEQQQGKFISGGGEASFNKPTSKEILQEASEMDGTLEGEEKSEEKRRQDEEWALYTETHPKGYGNTLNRG